jgi:hypothetical protein
MQLIDMFFARLAFVPMSAKEKALSAQLPRKGIRCSTRVVPLKNAAGFRQRRFASGPFDLLNPRWP